MLGARERATGLSWVVNGKENEMSIPNDVNVYELLLELAEYLARDGASSEALEMDALSKRCYAAAEELKNQPAALVIDDQLKEMVAGCMVLAERFTDIEVEEGGEADSQDVWIIRRLGVLAHEKGAGLLTDPKIDYQLTWF